MFAILKAPALSRTAVSMTAIAFALSTFVAQPAVAQSPTGSFDPTAARRPALLIHGNYCGPGNNAPLAPVDALDAACARHDACTPDSGLPTKGCNLALERAAAAIARDPHQPSDLQMMAQLVSAAATLMPAATDQNEVPRAVSAKPRVVPIGYRLSSMPVARWAAKSGR